MDRDVARAAGRPLSTVRRRGIGLADAWRGAVAAWRTTPNLRIEAVACVAASVVALWMDVSLLPVLLVSALVIVAEILNTSIERVVDLASPHHDEGARFAKDVAAGAVLVAAGFAVVVGLVHLGPALLARLP